MYKYILRLLTFLAKLYRTCHYRVKETQTFTVGGYTYKVAPARQWFKKTYCRLNKVQHQTIYGLMDSNHPMHDGICETYVVLTDQYTAEHAANIFNNWFDSTARMKKAHAAKSS